MSDSSSDDDTFYDAVGISNNGMSNAEMMLSQANLLLSLQSTVHQKTKIKTDILFIPTLENRAPLIER